MRNMRETLTNIHSVLLSIRISLQRLHKCRKYHFIRADGCKW